MATPSPVLSGEAGPLCPLLFPAFSLLARIRVPSSPLGHEPPLPLMPSGPSTEQKPKQRRGSLGGEYG